MRWLTSARTIRAGHRPRRSDLGTTTSEYALVLAGVAGAVVLAFALLVPAVRDLFGRAICALDPTCERTGPTAAGIDPWDDPDPVRRATWGKVAFLGDSYSSGEAADDYGAAGSTESCHASVNAYGPRLARRLDVPGRKVTFKACTGATIEQLAGRYLDHGQPPQIDGLDEDTSLVALTIGGNDLGWADVIMQCAKPIVDRCVPGTGLTEELARRRDQIERDLVRSYRIVRTFAPNARIVALGYPRFFPEEPVRDLSHSGYPVMRVEEQAWANDQASKLNEAIARAAADTGVEFVDTTDALAGHELTSPEPWMRGLTAGGDWGVSAASFHPTAAGQRALADLLEEQIRFPDRRT